MTAPMDKRMVNRDEVLRLASEVAIAAGDVHALTPAELADEPQIVDMLMRNATYWVQKGIDSLSADLAKASAQIEQEQTIAVQMQQERDALRAELAKAQAAVPRWIPIAEEMPPPLVHVGLLNMDRYQNCPDEMDDRNHIKDIGFWDPQFCIWSCRGERAQIGTAYTHWARLPPTPLHESAKENNV